MTKKKLGLKKETLRTLAAKTARALIILTPIAGGYASCHLTSQCSV